MVSRFQRSTKILMLAIAVLVALPITGMVYERRARHADALASPPAGSLIDVGTHRLHLLCVGSGVPLVMFESSGFGNATSFAKARSELSKRMKVCSYDRIGFGWSDSPPTRLSIGMLADDLRELQDAAALSPPLVIVTSSIGGLVTEMFARKYPDRVAALVFVDAAVSDAIAELSARIGTVQARAVCAAIGAAGAMGLIRLADPFKLRESTSNRQASALLYGAQPWNALCALLRGLPETEHEFASAPPLPPSVPLTVLSAERTTGLAPPRLEGWVKPLNPRRVHFHQQFAKKSQRGVWRMVPDSDHLIASSQPQAVVDAVLDTIERAR